MASETGDTSVPISAAGTSSATGAAIIARQDRIPIWSLSYLFIGIIGIGFLFTFFDITVSFIQTCTQIVPGCNPGNSATYLGLPVELNLAGYVVGALILSPLADRFGRRDMLLFTFFGFNLWVPMSYAWTTENFPTRARATGFALADGIGHLGGGVGILVIAPLIPVLLKSLGPTVGPAERFPQRETLACPQPAARSRPADTYYRTRGCRRDHVASSIKSVATGF